MNDLSAHEAMEMAISALLDGELAHDEQLTTIDHLLHCTSCRTFYHQARLLDGRVAETQAGAEHGDPPPAPEAVWARITAQQQPAVPVAKPRAWGQWLPQVAAVLLLAFGLYTLGRSGIDAPGTTIAQDTTLEVVLGSNPDGMTEARFLKLTTEVLEAEPRFHRQMYEIMRAVDAVTNDREGSGDEQGPRTESSDRRRVSLGDRDSYAGDGLTLDSLAL